MALRGASLGIWYVSTSHRGSPGMSRGADEVDEVSHPTAKAATLRRNDVSSFGGVTCLCGSAFATAGASQRGSPMRAGLLLRGSGRQRGGLGGGVGDVSARCRRSGLQGVGRLAAIA